MQPSNPDAQAEQRTQTARKCSRPRCPGGMLPSKAMAQTYSGVPDFPGGDVVTVSAGGPGALVDCLKCNVCGHSVTA